MPVRPRELPGRKVIENLQRFEWRFQTLRTDYEELQDFQNPDPTDVTSQHHYTNRERLHEAERRLHHFLSGYYTFRCLTTTLSESVPNPECGGRILNRRNEFVTDTNSRVVFGMRHYIQHHDILPLLVKMSALSEDFPKYAINKEELEMDDGYRFPQLPNGVIDESAYEQAFEYYYGGVDGICVYPIEIIEQNWDEVESLREDIYELARTLLQDELAEYIEQLQSLIEVREELREEEESFDQIAQEIEDITPGLRELVSPEIYDRVVQDNTSDQG